MFKYSRGRKPMKILAALKKIKHIDRKIEKNMNRIGKWCSYIVENKDDLAPTYNTDDISRMHQQISDWSAQKAAIRHAIHVTNIRTVCDWNGHKGVSIDELLLIQNVILPQKLSAQKAMRRVEKGGGYMSRHDTNKDSYVVLQYDPKKRDMVIESIENEKDSLDEKLDNLNIETDVIGID